MYENTPLCTLTHNIFSILQLSAVVNLDRPLNELSKVATPKQDNGRPAQTLLNDTPRVTGMGEGKGQNEAAEENGEWMEVSGRE